MSIQIVELYLMIEYNVNNYRNKLALLRMLFTINDTIKILLTTLLRMDKDNI